MYTRTQTAHIVVRNCVKRSRGGGGKTVIIQVRGYLSVERRYKKVIAGTLIHPGQRQLRQGVDRHGGWFTRRRYLHNNCSVLHHRHYTIV